MSLNKLSPWPPVLRRNVSYSKLCENVNPPCLGGAAVGDPTTPSAHEKSPIHASDRMTEPS